MQETLTFDCHRDSNKNGTGIKVRICYPADPFTIMENQNPSFEGSEIHKLADRRSNIVKGQVGYGWHTYRTYEIYAYRLFTRPSILPFLSLQSVNPRFSTTKFNLSTDLKALYFWNVRSGSCRSELHDHLLPHLINRSTHPETFGICGISIQD